MRVKIVKQVRQSISIQIGTNCEIIVKAPVYVTNSYIKKFLSKHKKWITRRVSLCKETIVLYNKKDSWPLWGQFYNVSLVNSQSINNKLSNFDKSGAQNSYSHNTSSKIYGQYLTFDGQNKKFIIAKSLYKKSKPEFRQIVYNFYKDLLRPKLEARVRVYLGLIRQDFNNLYIRNSSRRWGSCSVLKNLNFSFRLAWVPIELLDYVVAHEVAHLVYMNHSKAFWALVERMDKHYKKHRKELRKWEHIKVV